VPELHCPAPAASIQAASQADTIRVFCIQSPYINPASVPDGMDNAAQALRKANADAILRCYLIARNTGNRLFLYPRVEVLRS
jgi:hypothetical protein